MLTHVWIRMDLPYTAQHCSKNHTTLRTELRYCGSCWWRHRWWLLRETLKLVFQITSSVCICTWLDLAEDIRHLRRKLVESIGLLCTMTRSHQFHIVAQQMSHVGPPWRTLTLAEWALAWILLTVYKKIIRLAMTMTRFNITMQTE